jgi:alpha-1,2-mannosyltransferase
MYVPLPGTRTNMNPPHFQLLLEPLTTFSEPTASAIFRIVSIASLCGCLWWLARTPDHRWSLLDFGAVLAWAPMATVISLNQVTWILWPLLLWTWWCWRKDRWTAGAIGYGLALSLKPFVGVFLVWLLATRRWKAAGVATGFALAGWTLGLLAYGADVFREWLLALGNVQWWWSPMNASLEGWLARLFNDTGRQLVALPPLVAPLALVGQLLIIIVTTLRTRTWTIDESWSTLMAASLLASPLGWIYYVWWILPGSRPGRWLFQAPMLWLPLIFVAFNPNRFVTATLGSFYFWGLLSVWLNGLRGGHVSDNS